MNLELERINLTLEQSVKTKATTVLKMALTSKDLEILPTIPDQNKIGL